MVTTQYARLMAAPTLKIDTVKVSQLVADFRAGRLMIPEFQRDYVWQKSKAPRIAWLALAALTHRYSRSTESNLDQDLRACRGADPIAGLLANLRHSRTSLLAKPSDFAGAINDRSGLLAAYVACKYSGMQDLWTGQNIVMHSDIDRHHILPRRQFPESIRTNADKVANVAFITSDVNKAIGHSGPEVYLSAIKPDYLKRQCIPTDSSLWRVKQAEAFFAARRKLLAESFNAYLRDSLPGRKL
jgi:hypothetical protein